MNRVVSLLVLVGMIMLPAGGRAADAPFEIDTILPLTGTSTFIGQGSQVSLQALERSVNAKGGINGRPIKFVFYDDGTNPSLDVQLANAVIARNAPIIIGPASVSGCRAIQPLIKNGPIMYCMSPGLYPDPGTFAFSSNVSTIDLVTAALRYFVVGGTRRIAIITAIDANGQDAERSFNAALERLHAESYVVAREHFNVNDLSVAAQMQHIAAANPQLVIAWSSGTPMGTLLRGVNEAGLGKLPILTTNANANHSTLEQFAPLLPAGGLYFPLRLSEIPLDEITDAKTRQALQAYLAAMKAVGVDKPDESNDGCWDLGSIVVDAFRKLGTNATAEQLRAYISGQSGWTGIQGAYDFRAYPQRGLSQNAVVLTRWDPRRDAWVEVSKLGGAPLK